jgi:hypothetical protein
MWQQEFDTALDTTNTWRLGLWHEGHTSNTPECLVSPGTLKQVTNRANSYRNTSIATASSEPPSLSWQEGPQHEV